ncbi:MAG: hypothetical protein NTW28_34815 [Candidatus Solibacter sp.]|nr:hypothetical protein [Candidatus Solibacter sp.]
MKFTGTATLDSPTPAAINIYDSKGRVQFLPLNITGPKISRTLTLYIEGAAASAGLNTTQLSLSLAGGDKTIVHSPAIDSFTCVEVTLQLCQYKPVPGGGDPAQVPDQIQGGRNLHLQTPGWWAGRALLIVRQAQPAAYTGNVVLQSQGGKVRTFAYGDEVPAGGQAAQADPLSTPNATLGAPLRLWVEGAAVSRRVLDTGFTLGISDLPGVEGDRANITVVGAVLNIYDVPRRTGRTPPRIADGSKMNPGRALHFQDGPKNFARAMVKVKRVQPKAWTGNLEVRVWDQPGATYANPRAALFTGAGAADPAYVNPVAHPGGVPKAGAVLWAEGATTSGALRDTELHLRVTDAEGFADAAAITVHEFRVSEITFNGVRDIHYARIPTAGSYILTPPADPPATHLASQLRPAAGTPHWRRQAGLNPAAEFSWPAVYGRRDASGVGPPTLDATLELFPKVAGVVTARIQADSGVAGVRTEEKAVTFTNGDAVGVNFAIERIPNTVKRLNGIELQWNFQGPAHKTKHTLFLVDKMPRAANNLFVDEYLWEIFEWSCGWADGVKKSSNVFNAIWSHFHPAAAAHDTGLVYWRNWNAVPAIAPAQDLVTAIHSQDHFNPAQQNAANCTVFDRILMNCLGAHGIASAEVILTCPPGAFMNAGNHYRCMDWNDTTVDGQGNLGGSPPGWKSHWIAAVKLGGWKYYDASCGDGPVKAPTPGVAVSPIDVFKFEPITVLTFSCVQLPVVGPGVWIYPARSARRSVPPHLDGTLRWTNK